MPGIAPSPVLSAAMGVSQTPNPDTQPDPEQADHDLDLHAYGLAAKAGDTEAMNELHQSIAARQARMSARKYSPVDERSLSSVPAGMAQSITQIGRTVGRKTGLESEADAAEADKLDKPLEESSGGKVGRFVGQTAATLPIGMAGGTLTRALPWLAKATPGAGAAAARLGTRAAIGAGENALSNELTGDDATGGAELGAGMSILTGTMGKLAKGVVGKSDAAANLYRDAEQQGKDLFIPISQGGTGVAKQVYQKALPYALGVETQLKNQSKAAKGVVSQMAAEHDLPELVGENGVPSRLPVDTSGTGEQTAESIRNQYNQAYNDTVKSHAFNAPENFHQNVLDALEAHSELGGSEKQQIASAMDEVLQGKAENGQLNGAQLTDAMKKARMKLEGLEKQGIGNPAATNAAITPFHDIVQDAIDEHRSMLGGKMSAADRANAETVVRDLENYQRLGPAYAKSNAVASTAEANVPNRGEMNFGKLANNAPPNSKLRAVAQDAHDVLENESAGTVNPAGRHFLHGGGTVLAALHPALIPGIVSGNLAGNALATKAVQKSLYGDTATQKAIAQILRNNPYGAHVAGFLGRQGIEDAKR